MKRASVLLILFLGVAGMAPATAQPNAGRHLVLLSIDGLMPEYYLQADALGLKVPHMRRLMAEGAFTRGVIGVLPTVTYPSHTTMITGVLPRVHGIESNTIFDPEELSNGAWNWYADAIRVPTLLSAAKARWMTTASIAWPVTVGIGSDYNVPEFWRPGASHPIDGKLLEQLSTPGLLRAVAQNRGRPLEAPHRLNDQDKTDAAAFILRTYRPQLLLLHITALDSAQHGNGPKTPPALEAVEAMDRLLGQLLETVQATGLAGSTAVAVVSDHGFLPTRTLIKPNTVLQKAGLLTLNDANRVREWQAVFHVSGGSAALHLKDPDDAGLVMQIRRLFEPLLADPASGLRDILDAERVRRFGGTAPLVLNAREGFYFSAAAHGALHDDAPSRGTHGYAPDRPELYASLLLTAPGLKRKGDLGVVAMTSIAPTLAQYLGLTLSADADKPLAVW